MSNKTFKLNAQLFVLSLIAIAAVSYSVTAETNEDRTLSPYFFVKGDPAVDRLPLKDTRVEISVSGVIADVKVMQTYKNEGTRPIKATYKFPASTRAAVYSMRMKIGDQLNVARIKEREAAKKEFDTAKKVGKNASLLEESQPNVFSMKLAIVMPMEQIEIELHYTKLLVPTDGVYEVVYPTLVRPPLSIGRFQKRRSGQKPLFPRRRTAQSLPKAIASFQMAIEIHPDYALAHVGIADFYLWANIYGLVPVAKSYERADKAARTLQKPARSNRARLNRVLKNFAITINIHPFPALTKRVL